MLIEKKNEIDYTRLHVSFTSWYVNTPAFITRDRDTVFIDSILCVVHIVYIEKNEQN